MKLNPKKNVLNGEIVLLSKDMMIDLICSIASMQYWSGEDFSSPTIDLPKDNLGWETDFDFYPTGLEHRPIPDYDEELVVWGDLHCQYTTKNGSKEKVFKDIYFLARTN